MHTTRIGMVGYARIIKILKEKKSPSYWFLQNIIGIIIILRKVGCLYNLTTDHVIDC